MHCEIAANAVGGDELTIALLLSHELEHTEVPRPDRSDGRRPALWSRAARLLVAPDDPEARRIPTREVPASATKTADSTGGGSSLTTSHETASRRPSRHMDAAVAAGFRNPARAALASANLATAWVCRVATTPGAPQAARSPRFVTSRCAPSITRRPVAGEIRGRRRIGRETRYLGMHVHAPREPRRVQYARVHGKPRPRADRGGRPGRRRRRDARERRRSTCGSWSSQKTSFPPARGWRFRCPHSLPVPGRFSDGLLSADECGGVRGVAGHLDACLPLLEVRNAATFPVSLPVMG